jgi:hypothetical protein
MAERQSQKKKSTTVSHGLLTATDGGEEMRQAGNSKMLQNVCVALRSTSGKRTELNSGMQLPQLSKEQKSFKIPVIHEK